MGGNTDTNIPHPLPHMANISKLGCAKQDGLLDVLREQSNFTFYSIHVFHFTVDKIIQFYSHFLALFPFYILMEGRH